MAPFAVLLPRVCDLSSIYTWMFVANWRVADLRNPGFRLVLLEWIGTVIVTYLTLFLWSWVCGFVLGSLSGSSAWINGMIMACVWIAQFPERLHGTDDSNTAVFSHSFYRVTFPLLLQAFFVLVPCFRGMHRGFRLHKLRADSALCLTLAIAILTVLMMFTNAWWHLGKGWPIRIVLVVAQWPLVYLVVNLSGRRRQVRTASH